MSARDKLRDYFEKNVGKVLTTQELREVAGISEYARRIRELRDQEGMQIRTHLDRIDLKPGEYFLESLKREPALERTISTRLRMEILERNGFTCQLCGAGPEDPDPYNPKRKVRLHIDHIKPLDQGGPDDRDNLRVLCSACNEGKQNVQPPSETAMNIIKRIRRLPKAARMEIYEFLKRSMD